MNRTTKQYVAAAYILASVTVLSLGIRHVRLSAVRARGAANAPSVNPPSAPVPAQPFVVTHYEDNTDRAPAEYDYQTSNSRVSDVESDPQPADVHSLDIEAHPQHAGALNADLAAHDHVESRVHSGKQVKTVYMDKLFKGDYAKSMGSKGLTRISMGVGEDIYIYIYHRGGRTLVCP